MCILKKLISLFLAAVMMLSLFAGITVYAEEEPPGDISSITFAAANGSCEINDRQVFNSITLYLFGEKELYTVSPEVISEKPRVEEDRQDVEADVSREQAALIHQIALLGSYPVTTDERLAKQLLIWEVSEGYRTADESFEVTDNRMADAFFGSVYSGAKDCYDRFAEEIRSLNKIPSFAGGDEDSAGKVLLERKLNYSVVLTDENKVLERFNVHDVQNGLTLEKRNDNLVVRAAREGSFVVRMDDHPAEIPEVFLVNGLHACRAQFMEKNAFLKIDIDNSDVPHMEYQGLQVYYEGKNLTIGHFFGFSNLEPGVTYEFNGNLCDKSDAEILDRKGYSFTADADHYDGALFYRLDGTKLDGRELTADLHVYDFKYQFESAYTECGQDVKISFFKDVPENAYYTEAVDFVRNEGLFSGTEDDKFSPNMKMTRAMLVTVIWRMAEKPESSAELPFRDVNPKAYYYPALQWCYENNIILGVSADRFAPDDPITREMFATIFYRTAKAMGAFDREEGIPEDGEEQHLEKKNKFEFDESVLDGFTDAGKISSWAREGMIACVQLGLIKGTSETELSPRAVATRAQVATILYRTMQLD